MLYTPKITLSEQNNLQEFANVSADIAECEKIVKQLMLELSKVDSSIANLTSNFFSIAGDCMSFADSFLTGIDENNLERNKGRAVVGLVAGAAGMAVATAGLAVGTVKHVKAKIEHRKKMNELLEKKKLIAEEKLSSIVDILSKMHNGVCKRVEALYEKEFAKTVECDDSVLDAKTMVFKKSFGMVLKTRLLYSSLEYIVAELKAWKNGTHNSDYHALTVKELFEQETMTWPKKLKSKSWEQLMSNVIQSQSKTIPVPVMFTLKEPAMLQIFGRVDFPLINNESIPLCGDHNDDEDCSMLPAIFKSDYQEDLKEDGCIHLSGSFVIPDSPVKSIVENNSYYKQCNHLLNTQYVFPKSPKGFGIGDLLIVCLTIIAVIGYYILISNWLCDHGFFRWIFYLLPFFIIYGIYLYKNYCDFEDIFLGLLECLPVTYSWYISKLPYKVRKREYDDKVNETLYRLTKAAYNINHNNLVL